MPTSSTKRTVKKLPKKAAKKTIKASASKASKKKITEFKALVCAYDGECFWSRDGQILSNLSDLSFAIGSMDDEVFLHHVTDEKNDFADWVEHVLQDQECAQALRAAQKKTQAKKIVELHLRNYSV